MYPSNFGRNRNDQNEAKLYRNDLIQYVNLH